MDEWLPERHLARFVVGVVDELDLSEIISYHVRKDGRGKAAYHPAMLVRLLLYGYAVGMRSSRKIEKATYENIAFRYLAADQHPDHTVLADFRKTHLEELSKIFVTTLQLCQKAGLVKLGQIAIDGTKVLANASRQESKTYERLSEKEALLDAEVKRLLQEAAAVDAQEDRELGKDKQSDELPEALATAERRLEKIRAAKEELEREAKQKAEQAAREQAEQNGKAHDEAQRKRWQRAKPGVPDAKTQGNLTDPESRLMVDGANKTYVQAYNAQVAAAGVPQIIVAQTVTQAANDRQQLTPMVQQVEQNVGRPELTVADSGYWSEYEVAGLQTAGWDVLVPPDRGKKKDQDELPKNAPQGPAAQQMRERLAQEEEQKRYRKRSGMVEPVFGLIKEILGYRRFLLRGLKKVQGEWSLICASFNLRKLFLYGSQAASQ
jgi:transposase